MPFFDTASDRLTRPLEPSMAGPCADIKALVEMLNVESYTQMGHLESERQGRLMELESRLEAALSAEPASGGIPDRRAALAFARAYRLVTLYPDTVGNTERIIATLPALTFSCVQPPRADPARHTAIFARLTARLGLHAGDVERIEKEYAMAAERLERRRRLVGLLRAELCPDPAQTPGSAEAHAFFGLFFPNHPLQPGEVEVVATESCLYFCILSNDAFKQSASYLARDEAARKETLDYLERLRRFNFYNFSHFPAFTSFDARDMDPARVDALTTAMKMSRAELIALLNTAVFVEERDNLDKYLIHDSWGHYWQADLTQLGSLYDRMASLQLPLSPSDTVRLGDKLCTFLDLVYLRRDGTLTFDEALARNFATAWTFERFEPLLAPVIAEMAADTIEYRFRADCRAVGLELPSSSLFSHHPAKIDFAWADLSFFVKSLKRVNNLYLKDEELKAGFVERARLLFRLKYRRNYAAVASSEALDKDLKSILERLLAIFNEVQEEHLGMKLETTVDADGKLRINAFFQVFINLLQAGMTLNRIVHGQLEKQRPHLNPHLQTLIIFMVKYFERDPLRGFWSLDETLASSAVPLLETLAACEREITVQSI